jgi:cytochrome c oxidase cbb3-type subunit IV
MTYETVAAISGATSLVYFLVIFAAVLGYALWPKNAKRFDDAASIPLRED